MNHDGIGGLFTWDARTPGTVRLSQSRAASSVLVTAEMCQIPAFSGKETRRLDNHIEYDLLFNPVLETFQTPN